MRCFDFDMLVVHDPSGQCPRYTGGECHPEPLPEAPPYDEDQERAIQSYEAWKKYASGDREALDAVTPIKAKGKTIDSKTGEEVDSVDPRSVHLDPATGKLHRHPAKFVAVVRRDENLH